MKDIKTLKFKDIKHFVSFVMREYNKLDSLNYEDIAIIVTASDAAAYVTEFIR